MIAGTFESVGMSCQAPPSLDFCDRGTARIPATMCSPSAHMDLAAKQGKPCQAHRLKDDGLARSSFPKSSTYIQSPNTGATSNSQLARIDRQAKGGAPLTSELLRSKDVKIDTHKLRSPTFVSHLDSSATANPNARLK